MTVEKTKSDQCPLRNPSRPYCCVHARSHRFLLSSVRFIRRGQAMATSHPSPSLSSSRATTNPQNASQLPDSLSRPHLGLVQVRPCYADFQGRRRALRLRNDSRIIQHAAITTGGHPLDHLSLSIVLIAMRSVPNGLPGSR